MQLCSWEYCYVILSIKFSHCLKNNECNATVRIRVAQNVTIATLCIYFCYTSSEDIVDY